MIEDALDRLAGRAPQPVIVLLGVAAAVALVGEWLLYVAGYAVKVAWDETRRTP